MRDPHRRCREIIAENILLPKKVLGVIKLIKRQEELISEYISLGKTRDDFFRDSRLLVGLE